MDLDELRFYSVEGGIVYLPYFELLSRPHEVAGLLQASLAELDRDFRVAVSEHKDEEDTTEKHFYLSVRRRSRPEDQWRVMIRHFQLSFQFKNVLSSSLEEYTKDVVSILRLWMKVADLSSHSLDWAGVQLAVVFDYASLAGVDRLPSNTLAPDGLLGMVGKGVSGEPQVTDFEISTTWQFPAEASAPDEVRQLRLLNLKDDIGLTLDYRNSLESASDVEALYLSAQKFFVDHIFERAVVPLVDLPSYKGPREAT